LRPWSRWARRSAGPAARSSPPRTAAAAIAVSPDGTPDDPKGIPVFARKGETLDEYWWWSSSTSSRTSLAILIASIVLLDTAVQSLNILNATRLFAIAGNARSRVNTAMITSNFVAGSIGSAAARLLWTAGGWTAVTTTELIFAAFGFMVWLLGRRGPLVIPQAEPAVAAHL
jgi:S-adenosylhomocysteine hydrolase